MRNYFFQPFFFTQRTKFLFIFCFSCLNHFVFFTKYFSRKFLQFFCGKIYFSAEKIIGRIIVASPSTVTCLAFPFIFPQEIASRVRAPDKLPSYSTAVVM